jgi:hypothetical protein
VGAPAGTELAEHVFAKLCLVHDAPACAVRHAVTRIEHRKRLLDTLAQLLGHIADLDLVADTGHGMHIGMSSPEL